MLCAGVRRFERGGGRRVPGAAPPACPRPPINPANPCNPAIPAIPVNPANPTLQSILDLISVRKRHGINAKSEASGGLRPSGRVHAAAARGVPAAARGGPLLRACPAPILNPSCASQVAVRKAYGDLYAAVIDKKVAMKIGPGDWR